MVSKPAADVQKRSIFGAKVDKTVKKPSRERSLISPKQLSAVCDMDGIRGKFLAEGILQESSELITHSRRQGTKSHYDLEKFLWLLFREKD